METIGIIGFGKFGSLLKNILEAKCSQLKINIYDSVNSNYSSTENLNKVLNSDIIIPSVPIGALENTVKLLEENVKSHQVIIDVSSVKVFSKKIFAKLSKKAEVLLTHPMFGPGTLAKRDLNNLNICVENINVNKVNYEKIINFLEKNSLNIHYLNADEHDKLTASFQFTSLYFASLLKEFNFKESKIDTISYKKLLEFIEYVSADKKLMAEFYKYNPYCEEQLKVIKDNFDKVYSTCKLI